MGWLTYADDEVGRFHPVFQDAADKALAAEGMQEEFSWIHHHRTPGNRLVPDFVLCRKASGRWSVSMEIKRNPSSVYSTRNQIQAQGYATANADQYESGSPQYFAISNLEETLLFAQRVGFPPNECRLQDGILKTGRLNALSESDFRDALISNLRSLSHRVVTDRAPVFDEVWPHIVSEFIRAAAAVAGTPSIEEPTSDGWPLVQDYFCHPLDVDTARILILRCLFAEYIHGVLERFGHSGASGLTPLVRTEPGRVGQVVANALERLRRLDFSVLFEASCLGAYRALGPAGVREKLSGYVESIVTRPSAVRELARDRLDRSEFLDGVVYASHRGEDLDDRGKVLTDPELAALLSAVSVRSEQTLVLDPCCGDGALLEAAYDRLRLLGLSHERAIESLSGVEADPIFVRLTFLRLMMKEPNAIGPTSELDVKQGDMFSATDSLASADVVLMNPPFRRYEAQDPHPVPQELRAHYATQIADISSWGSIATTGQQNLFTYYVEFAVAAARDGCRMGIILDNKWYHNDYGAPLRKLLKETCAIEAIIEYPFANLFSGWTIATSMVVCTRQDSVPSDHSVKFIRCSLDLAQINLQDASALMDGKAEAPAGWTCNEKKQKDLDHRVGWKNHFSDELICDYREGLPGLPALFRYARRGSLAKEEGGMSAIAFPFSSRSFGHVRERDPDATRRYQNKRVRKLTQQENAELRGLADAIGDDFRGFSVNNPDVLEDYTLTEHQLTKQPTLEPPILRQVTEFWSERKSRWLHEHDQALEQVRSDPAVRDFIDTFRRITALDQSLMPDDWLFVGLREPYAGELIVPRKTRVAHRVYINPFACGGTRQVRLSSNFVSYVDCTATDPASGLDRLTAARIIAAFLVSSFGQLQFEMEGYNREGLLSVEEHHLVNVRVPDPRTFTVEEREQILRAFDALPYPVPTDRLSSELHERNALDEIFASVFCSRHEEWTTEDLVSEVHQLLDEYVLARSP